MCWGKPKRLILQDSRKDFADIIIGYATGEIEAGLQKNMVKECHMREACKSIFSELLKKNVEQIRDGRVSEKSLDKNRSKIKELRAKAQYDQCSKCFTERLQGFSISR